MGYLSTGNHHSAAPMFFAKTDPCPKNEGWVDILSVTITFQGEYISLSSPVENLSVFPLGLFKGGRRPSNGPHSSY